MVNIYLKPSSLRNARLMHTFTSLIGAPLRVELQSGKIFEGILTVGSSSLQKLKLITQLFADFFSWLWGSAGGGSWGEPLTVDHSNREKAIFSTLNKWTFSFSLFCTYFINLCFYLRWSNLTLTLLMWRQSSPKLSSPWKMLSSKSPFLRTNLEYLTFEVLYSFNLRFCVMNTDLSYASKEDFQTDAQIAAAKQNGEVGPVTNILRIVLLIHPISTPSF